MSDVRLFFASELASGGCQSPDSTSCDRNDQGIDIPRSPNCYRLESAKRDYSMDTICHSRWFLLTAVLSCVITVGCGSADEARDAHHDEHNEQEHDDHEHLEHFVPAHKPKDFEQLVVQLAVRFSQLSSASATDANDKSATTARQELADIIGWIPELAADSELRRSDFESAVAAANKLANVFKETAASANAKPGDAADFEPMIEQLRQLVPKSQSQAKTEQK